jgi:hypothetical protein
MPRWTVVVPTNRPDRFKQFLDDWHGLFDRHRVSLVVVQDLPENHGTIVDAGLAAPFEVEFHAYGSILAKHIPRKTDMIRSWGIYRAWQRGSKFTLTLDDDTAPACDVFEEYERVFLEGAPLSDYLDVGSLTSFGRPLRGFPFRDRERREVAVQYGGWQGVLDYDAPTQLAGVNQHESFGKLVVPVPRGAAVTGCIMNAAWRTEYAPIMWQLPLHEGKYNRFGDIWSGLLQKRTLDALGKVMVVNGAALVRHERASDPVANLEREMPGIPVNEGLWPRLAPVKGDGLLGVYEDVTNAAYDEFYSHDKAYAKHFWHARDEWLALYQ